MKKQKFWEIIETAWTGIPDAHVYRHNLALGFVDSLDGIREVLPAFLEAMKLRIATLSDNDVRAFDRILSRILYDLDRPELHRYTSGTNDGFLYKRGFVVALGKAYHDAIDHDESLAIFSFRYYCEDMTYVTHLLSDERCEELYPFGSYRRDKYDRESFENKNAWARATR